MAASELSVPRRRGDEPDFSSRLPDSAGCHPFPAGAGMNRATVTGLAQYTRRSTVPRRRGDEPSEPRLAQRRLRGPFPAGAGMNRKRLELNSDADPPFPAGAGMNRGSLKMAPKLPFPAGA